MLITCPECGKPISDKAEKCVHCGAIMQTTEPIVETNDVVTENTSVNDFLTDDILTDDILTEDISTKPVQPKIEQSFNNSPKIDYMKISDRERNQLIKRFKKEVPEHSKAMKAQSVLGVFNSIYMIAMLIAAVILIVFLLALGPKVEITISESLYLTIAIILGAFFLHFAFMSFIFSTIIRMLNKRVLRNWKHMEAWSKTQNIENFKPFIIHPKYERIYQEIDINEE